MQPSKTSLFTNYFNVEWSIEKLQIIAKHIVPELLQGVDHCQPFSLFSCVVTLCFIKLDTGKARK